MPLPAPNLTMQTRKPPGVIRDAIISVLNEARNDIAVEDIIRGVTDMIGEVAPSSVRSYLRLNTPGVFHQSRRGYYAINGHIAAEPEAASYFSAPSVSFFHGKSTLYLSDCFEWMKRQPENSVHAVVTDPPYGLLEYTDKEQEKLKSRKGGVWRIPPSFDGHERSPLPRFTILTPRDLVRLDEFFFEFGRCLASVLVPGANVVVASNPLVSYVVSSALARSGLERRGELIRQVMTMRGGDRPKAAHKEFAEVSVMPRSMWEPWLLFRKPIENRVQDNLRRWKTGGFRRPSIDKPFPDMIQSSPTNRAERDLAPHPSLKPQSFLRALVRGVLPLGEGVVLDPFAGSGSTLAAAEAVGYESLGVERDRDFFDLASQAIPKLANFKNGKQSQLAL